MANLKLVPGVKGRKPKRSRRQRGHSKAGDWLRLIRLALIVKRIRRRESSSPSLRQIALVLVTGGVAIVIIRGASRRAMAAKRARSADAMPQDQAPAPRPPSESATSDPDTASEPSTPAPQADAVPPTPDPDTASEPSTPEPQADAVPPTPGSDDGLTEAVRVEMFENKD